MILVSSDGQDSGHHCRVDLVRRHLSFGEHNELPMDPSQRYLSYSSPGSREARVRSPRNAWITNHAVSWSGMMMLNASLALCSPLFHGGMNLIQLVLSHSRRSEFEVLYSPLGSVILLMTFQALLSAIQICSRCHGHSS